VFTRTRVRGTPLQPWGRGLRSGPDPGRQLVEVVSERLGHASPGFTLNVYLHVLPGMHAEAAQVFDRLLGDDVS